MVTSGLLAIDVFPHLETIVPAKHTCVALVSLFFFFFVGDVLSLHVPNYVCTRQRPRVRFSNVNKGGVQTQSHIVLSILHVRFRGGHQQQSKRLFVVSF